MKQAITALALLTSSVGAHASTAAEGCKSYQAAAESVMQIRQTGMGPEFIYERAENAGLEMTPIFQRMVTAAYDVPKYETEAGWERAIREYGNRWYALCRENWDG